MIRLLYILPILLLGSAPTLADDAQNMAAVMGMIETINERRLDDLGDYVALRATLSATQTGQFEPFPPGGKQMKIPFMGILRIEDGKVAEIWVEWDNLNALVQLGHFPPPGQPVE